MVTFDYSVEAELFPRGTANMGVDQLGTDDLPGQRTPFASQSKSFRRNCSSAPLWRSTEKDTAAKKFVACTIAPIFP
jgi:hypothetical protein